MINSLQGALLAQIGAVFQEIFGSPLPLSKLDDTREDFEGDFTLVVFSLVKISKKSPEETARLIGEALQNRGQIARYNVVKGFLNMVLPDEVWLKQTQLAAASDNYGKNDTGQNQKVMVEYSSPNTNKPLHLGHIRNNLLGYSVSEILKWNGYEVIKVNLVNDRGIHICKSMIAWQRFGNGETPQSSGLKGDKLVGKYYVEFDKAFKKEVDNLVSRGIMKEEAEKSAPILLAAQQMLRDWEAGVPEVIQLWETMNHWVYDGFNVTYKRLGVDFDRFYYESNTYLLGKELVAEGLEKGAFFKKEDGSVWIDLSAEGLDQKVLLRSDGTSVYMTQDMGTADLKYQDFGCEKSVYVVGNEQDYHFKVLFKILEKLGKPYAAGLYHLSYGMVDLPSGKMKSREGTVVDADDLMDEMFETAQNLTRELGKAEGLDDVARHKLNESVGLAALKYFLLKVDPQKRLLFNPDESVDFQGNTGPFLQYTHARLHSLLIKASEKGLNWSQWPVVQTLHPLDKAVMVQLYRFPAIVKEAGDAYSPALVANYLYLLVKTYNRMYQELSVINEEDAAVRTLRLAVSELTMKVLRNGLAMLGISAPERM